MRFSLSLSPFWDGSAPSLFPDLFLGCGFCATHHIFNSFQCIVHIELYTYHFVFLISFTWIQFRLLFHSRSTCIHAFPLHPPIQVIKFIAATAGTTKIIMLSLQFYTLDEFQLLTFQITHASDARECISFEFIAVQMTFMHFCLFQMEFKVHNSIYSIFA